MHIRVQIDLTMDVGSLPIFLQVNKKAQRHPSCTFSKGSNIMHRLLILPFAGLLLIPLSCSPTAERSPEPWPADRAWIWYHAQQWLVGGNFIPSTAVNQLEMWQPETFDPVTINRELGYARSIGMNIVRVFLHDLAWNQDPPGFKARIDTFLTIADRNRIRVLFVFFDDCWNDNPQVGPQRDPIPGVHNSGWLMSPGTRVVNDSTSWGRLEKYVKDILTTFGDDQRVAFWDLYNEPGNGEQNTKSLPLLRATFRWARQVAPSQPLTAGLWYDNAELNSFQISASDVITFHNYNDSLSVSTQIAELKKHGRPVICTEWLRRNGNSLPATHLPVFKREDVGCINWGLVSGKTQTIFPWGSPKGSPEPKVWFHDLFHKDGTPFDQSEAAVFRRLTNRPRR